MEQNMPRKRRSKRRRDVEAAVDNAIIVAMGGITCALNNIPHETSAVIELIEFVVSEIEQLKKCAEENKIDARTRKPDPLGALTIPGGIPPPTAVAP
jgi:hypothetical protein